MKPNILMIVVDCLRKDTFLSAVENTLKNYFDQGTFYGSMINTATTTTPSFASILTGLYPPAHGIESLRGYKMNNSTLTIPKYLEKSSYYSRAEVTGPLVPEVGLDEGFDSYNFRNEKKTIYTDWGRELNSTIHELKEKENWFLLLHLFELHNPISLPFDSSKKDKEEKYRLAAIKLLERVRELLENLDMEETIVIITSDHGEKIDFGIYEYILNKLRYLSPKIFKFLKKNLGISNTRLMGHGFHIYDYLINVPFLVLGPGIPEGRVVNSQVSQIDIFPTLKNLVGEEINVHYDLQGYPLLPIDEISDRSVFTMASGAVIENKSDWYFGIRNEEGYKFAIKPYDNSSDNDIFLKVEEGQERELVRKEKKHERRGLKKELISLLNNSFRIQSKLSEIERINKRINSSIRGS